MDKTVLVNDDRQAGLELVRALDAAGVPVSGAFWYELPETGRWRLFIVSPWVEDLGLRATYHRIIDVIRSLPASFDLRLDEVTATDVEDAVVRRLVATFAAHSEGVRIDLSADTPNGVDLGDAYVYRLDVPTVTARANRRG